MSDTEDAETEPEEMMWFGKTIAIKTNRILRESSLSSVSSLSLSVPPNFPIHFIFLFFHTAPHRIVFLSLSLFPICPMPSTIYMSLINIYPPAISAVFFNILHLNHFYSFVLWCVWSDLPFPSLLSLCFFPYLPFQTSAGCFRLVFAADFSLFLQCMCLFGI